MVRNTYIYPPEPSMRIVGDIIAYTAKEMPKFNSISISGYHMQEAGATLVQELAYTLADGREYVRAALAKGLDIDAFAGRLRFFFAIGMNFFMEVAKLRAARLLWSRIMDEFEPKNASSLMLRTHCQTSGVSLHEQDPYNNIVRTAYRGDGRRARRHAVAAHQFLRRGDRAADRVFRAHRPQHPAHPAARDRGDQGRRSARRLLLRRSLTAELADKAWALIDEVEALGGMTKAVNDGLPKRLIEEAATRRQAAVDRGEEVIVGVNRYRLETEEDIEILAIDNAAVRSAQIRRIEETRRRRDSVEVEQTLTAPEDGRRDRRGQYS